MTLLSLLKKHIDDRSMLRLTWHRSKALIAAVSHGFPARKITVIGITGTDGKTTTVGMVAHILRETGHTVGAASTAFMQVNDERTENATHLTSLDPFSLQRFLQRLVKQGCAYAVIEMSSHGLVQGRTNWTFPAVAGITNLSMEHLDYHGTMERYRADKGRLFRMLRGKGTKVLNKDDTETFKSYSRIPSNRTIAFSLTEPTDVHVTDVQATADACSAIVHVAEERLALNLAIPGTYNIQNALCAIACAMGVDIDPKNAVEALHSFRGIPGRMERIDEGQDFDVFVDFAVSPQSYQSTLEGLRSMVGEQGRVLVLCGSCGNRMKEKRPEVGRICSELADVVVVTEDETYGEDPTIPWNEVWQGVRQESCEARQIFDRREAIRFLLQSARPGDAVVFCGMGPFSTFTKLTGRIPWDEREIVREELQALSNKTGGTTH